MKRFSSDSYIQITAASFLNMGVGGVVTVGTMIDNRC